MHRRVNVPPWAIPQPRIAQEYERARSRTANRKLYDTADWQKLRAMHLHEHPMCSVPGCRRRATVVDHVTAHRGEAILFYDPANLQSLCKPHHDSKTVRVDGGFGRTRGTTSTR